MNVQSAWKEKSGTELEPNIPKQSSEDGVEKDKDQEEYRYQSGQYITVHYYSSETHDRRESSG